MKKTPLALATILALGTAVISGFSNFIGKISVTVVKDPIVFTTLKNTVVAVLLTGIILAFGRWRELRSLSKAQWGKLLAIGIIGGSVPFALFFTGLTHTSALNGALIHKTLFLWVFLFGGAILRERLTPWQWIGIAVIAFANFFVGGFTGFKYNTGELMILGATILWAIENVIAKITLRDVSSLTVAAGRMIIGSLVLISFVLVRGGAPAVTHLNTTQWSWTLLSSGLLFGYVITWYAALKRAPATYVATLLVSATLITNVLSAIFVTHKYPPIQLENALGVTLGIILLIHFTRLPKSLPDASAIPDAERL